MHVRLTALLFLASSFPPLPAPAQLPLPEEKPIRIGRTPSLSPDGARICFSYQGNLWTVPAAGGAATRLTANDSFDINPKWSPDGKWIAFNSDREGGTQVFLIPSIGGPARQITFHSVPTTVGDWFPDGKRLAVTSTRDTRRETVYSLDVVSGRMTRLINDEVKCLWPSVSPDGAWIAYTRGQLADTIRKGYRGSANYDIYVAPSDGSAPGRRLTDSDRNDMWPCWSADSRTIYYSSERAGIATVWKQPFDGGRATEVVTKPPDAIRFTASSRIGKSLVFECDNRICVAPISGGPARDVPILCRTDEKGPRTDHATFTGTGVTEYAISPDGKRAAFVIRGDIFAVNLARGGEAKRLTDNPARDRDIRWSPDGKRLVFSSNRTGSYKIFTVDSLTGETKQVTTAAGSDSEPAYSPDGSWIAYLHGPLTSVRAVKVDGTGDMQIAAGPNVGEFRWSPDGRWIAFSRANELRVRDIWLTSIAPDSNTLKIGAAVNVSDHPGYNDQARWIGDGSKLAFRSNRYRNRDIETLNDQGRYGLYTVSLLKEPEKIDEDDADPKPAAATEKREEKIVKVDPDEIERRAKSIAAPEDGVGEYAVSPDGKSVAFASRQQGQPDIWQAPTEGGALVRLTSGGELASAFQWTADSSRIYYLSGGQIKWIPKGGGPGGTVSFTARMDLDRAVDYRAAFDEAWQVLNDRYYDKSFHGVDWKAIGAKYRGLLDSVTVRQDFVYLLQQMFAELNSSHTGVGPIAGRPVRQTGYLGILPDSAYMGPGVKISDVIRRGPSDHDESRLKPGEYILSIDDKDVQADASYDIALADKAGRTVKLLVNGSPDRTGARTVKLKPIARIAFAALLYEKWIDERRALAEKGSNNRVGYLHVTDMQDAARNRFERELFSIGMRTDAMVIDIRDNTGGDTHDSLLKILERNRHYFNFAPRTEAPFPQPERAWTKPIVLLTNGGSLSDAECFSNGFKELKLGKVVGAPTMGWIIFTSATGLVDGTIIRIPHIGCFTLDGRDMENWGAPPDIRADNTPADVAAGRDPQLEKAVQIALSEIHK